MAEAPRGFRRSTEMTLIWFVPCLLAIALSSQGCLDPLLLTRFQVERMPLDFLDDIFLLNLALESSKCVL